MWEVRYLVKNSSQGYVIAGKAKSPVINNKIPSINSEVRIYFDLFMTKLYKQYKSYSIINNISGHVNNGKDCSVVWSMNKNNWEAGTLTVYPNSASNAYHKPSCVKTFVSDPMKYISNIKFHIQKWEVVS